MRDENEIPASSTKHAELYPQSNMFDNVGGFFTFHAFGKVLYTMSYDEAYIIWAIAKNDKINAIRVLRTFRAAHFSLKSAKDTVEFIQQNFHPCGC